MLLPSCVNGSSIHFQSFGKHKFLDRNTSHPPSRRVGGCRSSWSCTIFFLRLQNQFFLILLFSKPISAESNRRSLNSKALLPPTPFPEYSRSSHYLPFSLSGLSSSGKTVPISTPFRWYSSFSHCSCLYSRQLQPQRIPYYALWLLKLRSLLASSGTHLPKRKIRSCDTLEYIGRLVKYTLVGR